MTLGNAEVNRYRFGDVEVDTRRRRVVRAGAELALEPKAFAVLVELLRHVGNVIPRDALLDAVWGHRHVTPAVLNRIVAILRRELGDDAEHPHLIRTVHGVGYEFIGELQTIADEPAQTPVLADALVSADESARAVAVSPARSPIRRRDLVLAVLLLAGASAFLFWSQVRRTSAPSASSAASTPAASTSAPSAAAAPTLVVLPLRALGGDHGETALAEGLSEELTTRLSRIEGLGMISATSAAIAQSRQFDAAQLAEHLKATHALEGSLRETDEQLRINLRLVELPTGKLVWTEVYDRKPTDVFTVQGDIARAIADALALTHVEITADRRSIDPTLLRRVHEARAILRDPRNGATKAEAETMMRALVAEHPEYAPGHGFLSVMIYSNHAGDAAAVREAKHEAELAQQLDPDEPESCFTLGVLAAQDADWERAIAMFRKSVQLAPSDPGFPGIYGRALASLGYVDEGLREASFGTAHDPLSSMALAAQASLLDTAGRHDEAHRQFEDYVAAAPERAGNVSWFRWFNAFWRRDDAGMQAALDTMSSDNNWTASYRAATAALRDAALWPQVWTEILASEKRGHEQHIGDVNFLRMSLPKPDYVQALAAMDSPLRNNWGNYQLMVWMPEYRAARQTPAFQDYLKRNRILDYWRAHGFPPQCRADGEGARCD